MKTSRRPSLLPKTKEKRYSPPRLGTSQSEALENEAGTYGEA